MRSAWLRSPIARFITVGGSNFVVSFAAFVAAYHYLGAGLGSGRGALANVVAYAAGMANSFVLNRGWTFRAEGSVATHALRFTLLNAATLGGSTAIMYGLVDRGGRSELIVWLPLTLVILAVHYLGMKHWAFTPRARATPCGSS